MATDVRGCRAEPRKTPITHIADGFDFLGFNLRKYHGKLLIKPAKARKRALLRKVQTFLDANRTVSTQTLLHWVNPLLRGWASYYRTVVSKQTCAYCDHRLYQMLWRWAKRRHPRKTAHWIKQQYFTQRGQRQWVFTSGPQDLFRMADVRIIRQVKGPGRCSPYRPPDAAYFERRRHQLLTKPWRPSFSSASQPKPKDAVRCAPGPLRNRPTPGSPTGRAAFGSTKWFPPHWGDRPRWPTCSSHTDGGRSNITDATDTIICRATRRAS